MSVMQGDKATQDDIERVLARLAELGRDLRGAKPRFRVEESDHEVANVGF
jgi:ribosome-interacting GTPase 1